MIVKPDCPVKLSSFQAQRISTQIQLGNYFQSLKGGAATLPPFSGFVKEFETIAKQFFIDTEFNLEDFVSDPHNAQVLKGVFERAFTNTPISEFDFIDAILQGVSEDFENQEAGANAADNAVKEEVKKKDEERTGFIDRAALDADVTPSQFKATEFESPQAFYKAMFHNTNYLEDKFKTFFTKDVIIRSLVIDTKTREIPITKGREGELKINSNLKNRRKEILTRLLENNPVHMVQWKPDPVTLIQNEVNAPLTAEEIMSNPEYYAYAIQELENRITKPTYDGAQVDLLDAKENNLYKIARDGDNDDVPAAKQIVNDYMDLIAFNRFDEVVKQSFGEYVSVNDAVDPFNTDLKYTYVVNRKEEAPNQNFEEVIRGLDTISDLYNIIMSNTPILNINTGLETKDKLTKPAIQKAFGKYFDEIDPRDAISSIKDILIKGMYDDNTLWENRNVLYTLYKNFYEEYGDDHFGNSYSENNLVETENKATDKYPESYLQTLVYNRLQKDHALMQLIAEPLKNIAPIVYVEASVNPYTGTVTVSDLSASGSTSTTLSIENAMFQHMNDREVVESNIAKYQPAGGTSLDSSLTFMYGDTKYGIKGSDSIDSGAILDIPAEVVHELAKDLLSVNFDQSSVDRDFKNELMSRRADMSSSGFPNYFMGLLRQAMKITVAKNELLNNNDVKNTILNKKLGEDLKTGNTVLNDIFTDRTPAPYYKTIDKYKVTFNRTDTLQTTLNAYKASKDRVTGNSSKSVVKNKQKNAISAYSTYNLFTGFKRNLNDTRKLHNSIVNHNPDANVFGMNPILQDPNFFKGFAYREALEVNERIVSNTKQSVLTTLHFDINGQYFSKLQASKKTDNVEVLIDPTVYSDKGKNAMARFSNDLVLDGVPYKLFLTDDKKITPETQSIMLLHKTNGDYYKKYAMNIVSDWLKVIKAAGGKVPGLANGMGQQNLSDMLKAINKFNSGDFWYTKPHPILRGRDAALFFANKVGVVLNNGVHYQAKGLLTNKHEKTPLVIKDSFIEELSRYESDDISKLKEYLDTKLINDVNVLRKNGFTLTGDSVAFVDAHYSPQDVSPFSNGQTGKNRQLRITRDPKVEAKTIGDILPAYRKFFYDWNFLTENLLNIALGNIHAHKGGNANAAWTAMTKRNVMAGASIRPYALGLDRGVEEHTRTAFVDDIVTPIKTIHGNTEGITDLDGGAFVTVTQRKKTYVSLNEQYQGNGGPEQKPFVSMMDFINGQNGVMKFADFVLDKEMIRNSIGSDIDWMRIHKDQLYNYPISHLNVTNSWNPDVNLSRFDDLYVFDRTFDFQANTAGRIEKIESIQHVNGNEYIINKSIPSVKNSSFKQTVILNTWYDLWMTLGGIDTVSPSKKKSSIYYTTANGAKVYFEESDTSWDKLLDYEAYIGDASHTTIKANYIPSSGDIDTDAIYELYKTLTGEIDVVIPKLEMMAFAAAGEPPTVEEYQALGMHNVTPYDDFVRIVSENARDVNDFFIHVNQNTTENPDVRKHIRIWQPIKGKLIDRITTAGAQKFGQMNINRNTTFSTAAKINMLQEAVEIAANDVPLYDDAAFQQMLAAGDIVEDCN